MTSAQIALAVLAAFLVQALTSFAMTVPSVLAPVAAPDLGVLPASVGKLVAFAYFVAIGAGIACGTLISRFGPIRILQVSVLMVCGGLALAGSASVAMVFIAMVAVGAAHGLVNPSTSQVLDACVPVPVRGLVFSIKQTGVPAGSAVGGVLIPFLLLSMDWRAALLVVGASLVVLSLLVQPLRGRFDPVARKPGGAPPVTMASVFGPVAEVWRNREIRELAFVSMTYSASQLCLMTYLVSYLKLDLGYSLVAAGGAFSAASMASVFGRIFWGWVADRTRAPRALLAALGVAMAVFGLGVSALQPGWPTGVVVALCAAHAGTAMAWNGVYFAEVARLSPPGRAGALTGGVQFFTFSGALTGPLVFAATVWMTGHYALGFVVFSVLPLLMGLRLALVNRRSKQRAG